MRLLEVLIVGSCHPVGAIAESGTTIAVHENDDRADNEQQPSGPDEGQQRQDRKLMARMVRQAR